MTHTIVVLSGKGGVGKSSVTAQLAWQLSQRFHVGVLDIDLTGPSMPRMFGLDSIDNQIKIIQTEKGWSPFYVNENLGVLSIGFMLASRSDAIIWRGPKKSAMIQQFLTKVDWKHELDYLIIDTPPGTSDEHLTAVEQLLGSKSKVGAVIITTPQKVAMSDVAREINFCKTVNLPIIGIIENMSGFVCTKCKNCTNIFSSNGGQILSEKYGLELLISLPIDADFVKLIESQTEDRIESYLQSNLGKKMKTCCEKITEFFDTIKLVQEIEAHEDRVWSVAVHNCMPLIASCSADRTIKIWKFNNNNQLILVDTLTGQHQQSIRSISWHPAKSPLRLAAASFDGSISIWSDTDGSNNPWNCIATLDGHDNEVKSVAWSASGELLASCSRDKTIWLWELITGDIVNEDEYDCISVLNAHDQDVKSLSWHQSEEILASSSYDDTVKLWKDDGDDWASFKTIECFKSTVWKVIFTKEGNLVACSEGNIKIFDRKYNLKSQSKVSNSTIFEVNCNSNEEIAYCDSHGVIGILNSQKKEKAHGTYEINGIKWIDNNRLITCGDDGKIKLWEVQSPLL